MIQSVLIFFIFFLSGPFLGAQTTESRYGAFSLFPQGSSRVMGMGGAFAAVSDDVLALEYNPAGLSFSDEVFLLGGTQNRVVNREAEWGGRDDFSEPYDFLFLAAAYNSKTWSVGVGYTSPFFLETKNFSEKTEFIIESIATALSYRVNQAFSVGVVVRRNRATEAYENTSSSFSLEQQRWTTSYKLGLMLRGKYLGIGLAYQPKNKYSFDQSYNDQIGVTYFRDVVVPAKFTLGASLQIHSQLQIVADWDFIEKVSDSILVGSGVSSGEIPLTEESYRVLHGGLEYVIVESKKVEVIGRAGAYQEPSRLLKGKERIHYTLGLEARLGPVILSVAFDQASSFRNTAQGFSVSLGHL